MNNKSLSINLSTKQLTQSFSSFLHRYHIVIFCVVVVGSLSVATFFLNLAMNPPAEVVPSTASNVPQLDTATMDKIDKLSDKSAPLVLPQGQRTNPFN